MTPILLAGGQWGSIKDLYSVLTVIISIIGLYILLPGVYKVFAGWKEGHGDQLQAGGKDVVIGIAILFFATFFLPVLTHTIDSMQGGGSPNAGGSGLEVGAFKDIDQSVLDKYWDDNDAAEPYKSIIMTEAGIVNDANAALFKAVKAAPDIMSGSDPNGKVQISTTTNYIKKVAINICTALKSLGFALALLFFLTSIIEFAKEERLNLETFIKHFSKFFIAVGFVAFSDRILNAVWGLGKEIGDFLSGVVPSVSTGNVDMVRAFAMALTESDVTAGKKLDIWTALGNLVSVGGMALIFNIIGLAMMGIMYFIAFSRLIEMGTRGAFLPVAFGLLADDGWRGAGGRYLKKFLAVCAQVGILIVISDLGSNIVGSVGNNIATGGMHPFQSMAMLCGTTFALVSAMFKSIGWMNDVFGA